MQPRAEEGLLAMIAAVGDMLRQAWDDDAWQPGHGPIIAVARRRVND